MQTIKNWNKMKKILIILSIFCGINFFVENKVNAVNLDQVVAGFTLFSGVAGLGVGVGLKFLVSYLKKHADRNIDDNFKSDLSNLLSNTSNWFLLVGTGDCLQSMRSNKAASIIGSSLGFVGAGVSIWMGNQVNKLFKAHKVAIDQASQRHNLGVKADHFQTSLMNSVLSAVPMVLLSSYRLYKTVTK
jgi:hypothetical protein